MADTETNPIVAEPAKSQRPIDKVGRVALAGWRFIGRNVATIVSISSMFIAYQSFNYARDAQLADLEYKEISIMPRPSLLPLSEDMSLSVRNLGLGPAVVKQIQFERDGKCITSHEKSPAEWAEAYRPFLQSIAADVFKVSLPSMPWIKGGKRGFDYELDMLQANDTIRAGEDRYLFRLDPGTLKEFRELDTTQQVVGKNKFAASAFAVPIIVIVCSATERTCMSVGVAEACARNFVKAGDVVPIK